MKSLIIYDSTGKEYMRMASETIEQPTGTIQAIVVDIPEGKIITGIDVSVTPNVAIYADAPKTEEERVAELEEENASINYALMMEGIL